MRAAHENLTVTKTVRELLFDGYEDRMLQWATKMNKSLVPFDKFGWFYEVILKNCKKLWILILFLNLNF